MRWRGLWERPLFFGPTQSFVGEIPRNFLSKDDYVRVGGIWSKVKHVDDSVIVTENGKTVRLASPGEDFRYKTPSPMGFAFLNFWLAIAAIVVAVYFGLRPRAPLVRDQPPSPEILR